MQQLTQQLKSGHMEILEVPFPVLGEKQVLVRNHFSVISAGTESKTVTDARKGYIAKARSRQKEVKQVIELIKTLGIKDTYNLVMNKLEAPSSLGYSCSGEVIAVGRDVTGFKTGDYVACGGSTAVHADVVAVPVNLCVKLPAGVQLKHASFATIASIALQGIRQADLNVGEHATVIGLGLIGQLTVKILEASGIRALGIDINPEQVNIAAQNLSAKVYDRNQAGLDQIILNETYGIGSDAVIITAGTSSLDPVNFAGETCRKKGKVVIVGAVPTGFERKNYYQKELDLRMSSSYGPGRYDTDYEEKGIDYPVGYVRWTENRNMQAYIDLLSAKKIEIDSLITHIYPLEKATEAYNMILQKSEPFTGILIQYDDEKSPLEKVVLDKKPYTSVDKINAGFIGAGSFAQNMLLPNLNKLCNFTGVATARGNTSKYVAEKYGFKYCTNHAGEILEDTGTNAVFIATRHNLHAKYVIEALRKGKNVFVEKPLALSIDELEEIKKVYNSQNVRLMVGFNRRFAPFTQRIKSMFKDEQPKSINIRVNAGIMPSDHWVNDPETGGGRIVGEGCHFIDLAMYLAGSPIDSLSAFSMFEPYGISDTVVVSMKYKNGSVASVSYFSNGDKRMPKELIEVFCGGTVIINEDFKKLTIYGKTRKEIKSKQDKGHKEELRRFISSIKEGLPCPIPFDDEYLVTLATYKVLQSIKEQRTIVF